MSELSPPLLLAGVIILALNAYVLSAGADFGGGIWDLLATGPRRDQQRDLIAHAIAPVWEANHVWLILVVVLLFTCFPPVFSRLAISLHVPLTLVLVGIVLRGSAFIFRSNGGNQLPAQRRWGRLFASASIVTPLLLGVILGALAAGRVRPPTGAGFVVDYLTPWLSPFTASVGVFTLALFAFLAAVYLTLETDRLDLREDFRARALAAAGLVFVAGFGTLALARREAPLVWDGLITAPRALPLHLLTGVAASLSLWALWRRHYLVARQAAVAQVTLILWGWALSQYPWMLPGVMTIGQAAAPPVTLRITLITLGVGAALLLPSLYYLFRIFKSAPTR